MSAQKPRDLFAWTQFLSSQPLPVLPATAKALQRLSANRDLLQPSDIAEAALTDPLLTLQILRRLQERKASARRSDITTIEHALMMLGIEPFFAAFSAAPELGALISDPQALAGVARVAKRSYVASRLALDWAEELRDMESEEVQVAALIHDMAELLLWIHAPEEAKAISFLMRQDPSLRSADAQARVLGFALSDAETELCRLWGLPELSRSLLVEQGEASGRALLVRQAARLARHAQTGLDNPALPDDWIECAILLDFETPEEARDALIPRIQARAVEWDARIQALNDNGDENEDGNPNDESKDSP